MIMLGRVVAGFACVGLAPAEIVINEIHYNSRPNDARDEFVELHNTGEVAVELGGWFFNDGFDYTFPPGTSIGAGGYVVVAQNPTALLDHYGVHALGPFDYEGRMARWPMRSIIRIIFPGRPQRAVQGPRWN